MGWKEFFSNLCFAQMSVEANQTGSLKVKIHKNIHHLSFHDPEGVWAFVQADITPEFERQIKEEAKRRLDSIAPALDLLPDSKAEEIVILTTVASSIEAIKAGEIVSSFDSTTPSDLPNPWDGLAEAALSDHSVKDELRTLFRGRSRLLFRSGRKR